VVGYFSSLSNRPIPLRYGRGDERIEIHGHSVVAREREHSAPDDPAHGAWAWRRPSTLMAAPHMASGALVELLQGWAPEPHAGTSTSCTRPTGT
jgi:LysR family transcriptional regulator for bpeEF and oprC